MPTTTAPRCLAEASTLLRVSNSSAQAVHQVAQKATSAGLPETTASTGTCRASSEVSSIAGSRSGTLAGIAAGAEHVAFLAPDISDQPSPPEPFGASIPLAKAMREEVLLAWAMNRQPLPRVAVVIDTGMPDVAVQKINQTFSALVEAFSAYDEVALYTYSSTVSQVTDFTGKAAKLTAALNQMKLVRGNNNGPPILDGPLAMGPMVNGYPVGGPPVQPVNTPPREAHVLNDALLRAALDLSKRERTRRKVIFVISNGRELGSKASYRDVLHLLETQGIQVKAVVVGSGALPLYRQLDKLHLKDQGYSNILPKYSTATGGGQVFSELSRNAMEEAYAQITSEARNQYTLGYIPKAVAGSSAYRSIEVLVDKKGLKIYAKDGYYSVQSAH